MLGETLKSRRIDRFWIGFALVSLMAGGASGASRARRHQQPYPVVEGKGYRGVIFPVPFDDTPARRASSWRPSAKDVAELEAGLGPFLKAALEDPSLVTGTRFTDEGGRRYEEHLKEWIGEILPNLTRYKRQYAGTINGSARIIVVNLFTSPWGADWRSEWVMVKGGGTTFWHINFNVATKAFEDFFANADR